jgi:cyclohexa-1,5-dienecarbonyl-CoA hydratase
MYPSLEGQGETEMPVDVQVGGGIAHVVIDDPPLNILTRALLATLRRILSRLTEDQTLRVMLLRAQGRHFSAGASVEEHLPGQVEDMIPEFIETILAVQAFPVPVVCAVQGRCLGGGMELALAADLVIAGESALLGVPEIGLGVLPPAACIQLPSLVPPGVAAELLFTGAPLAAAAAQAAGLVLRVVPDEELLTEATRLSESIAGHSAASLRATKRTLRAGMGAAEERMRVASRIYLDDLMQTADATEGLSAFTEKRTPQWSHS